MFERWWAKDQEVKYHQKKVKNYSITSVLKGQNPWEDIKKKGVLPTFEILKSRPVWRWTFYCLLCWQSVTLPLTVWKTTSPFSFCKISLPDPLFCSNSEKIQSKKTATSRKKGLPLLQFSSKYLYQELQKGSQFWRKEAAGRALIWIYFRHNFNKYGI